MRLVCLKCVLGQQVTFLVHVNYVEAIFGHVLNCSVFILCSATLGAPLSRLLYLVANTWQIPRAVEAFEDWDKPFKLLLVEVCLVLCVLLHKWSLLLLRALCMSHGLVGFVDLTLLVAHAFQWFFSGKEPPTSSTAVFLNSDPGDPRPCMS